MCRQNVPFISLRHLIEAEIIFATTRSAAKEVTRIGSAHVLPKSLVAPVTDAYPCPYLQIVTTVVVKASLLQILKQHSQVKASHLATLHSNHVMLASCSPADLATKSNR